MFFFVSVTGMGVHLQNIETPQLPDEVIAVWSCCGL